MDGNLDEFLRMRKTMSDDMFAEYVEYSDRYGCTLLHIVSVQNVVSFLMLSICSCVDLKDVMIITMWII